MKRINNKPLIRQADAAGIIHHAKFHQKSELLNTLNLAFSPPEGAPIDFEKLLPHMFTEQRLPQHLIMEEGGTILGCIGIYPYEMRIGGVRFKTAGIGQVATHPDARGRGVMSTLLNEACREMDRMKLDFSWLYGNRIRYGHFGWALGGRKVLWNLFENGFNDMPEVKRIRLLHPRRDAALVASALRKLKTTVVVPVDELSMLLQGNDFTGWILNRSFIVVNHAEKGIVLSGGNEAEIELLIAHYNRQKPKGLPTRICASETDTASAKLGVKHHYTVNVVPSAMFRVTNLLSLMQKIAMIPRPGFTADDRIRISEKESGQAVELTYRNGIMSAVPCDRKGATALSTKDLSELIFGSGMPEMFLPRLKPQSPFRHIFPIKACIPPLVKL